MRRTTDRLSPPRRLGPREEEAAALVAERPGMTVGELRDALGVGKARVWQIVWRLESHGRVSRDGEPPRRMTIRPEDH